MTVIDPTTTVPLRLVAEDLYRDIHKGIRAELFSITETAGRTDPTDVGDRAALAAHVGRVVDLLVSHAEHEDVHVQPALEQHLPDLAEQVEADHHRLEARIHDLAAMATEAVATPGNPRWHLHRLYVELAAFTSAYLAHQDLEERVIMPRLEDAVGTEAVLGIHVAIVSSIPPDVMAASLSVMLPAMNVDDRTELLRGMLASAPAEAFAGVWNLAGSVLERRDVQVLADRLSL